MSRKSRTTSSKFCDRERFNWGFWDGLADRDNGKPLPAWWVSHKKDAGHFDPVYSAGYRAGAWFRGTAPDTSDAAWHDYSN